MLGTEITTVKGKIDDQERSPDYTDDDEFDEAQFEILDDLHAKLQQVEIANIEMKQTAIENVRIIAKLENANQSLEAKIKKLSEAKNEHFEEL